MGAESHAYDDILSLPHHQSAVRAHMSLHDRAAQFSPFAALTGYAEAVEESARCTQGRAEIEEERAARLDAQLHRIMEQISSCPRVELLCFQPDERKPGGAYVTVTGRVRRVDPQRRLVLLTDGRRISFRDIYEIQDSPLQDSPGLTR